MNAGLCDGIPWLIQLNLVHKGLPTGASTLRKFANGDHMSVCACRAVNITSRKQLPQERLRERLLLRTGLLLRDLGVGERLFLATGERLRLTLASGQYWFQSS